MTSTKQKLGGLLFVLLGVGGTYDAWNAAINGGSTGLVMMFSPCFIVFGIAIFFLRPYKEERLARGEDISNLPPWKLFTPPWRVAVIVGLVAGFINFIVLRVSFKWSE